MTVLRFVPECRAILQVVFDGYADAAQDSDPLIIPVAPKSASIHRNGYSQADSWELTFDAGDLPIDPQLVRAGSVEIYIFDAAADDGQRRILSRRDPLADLDDTAQPHSETDAVKLDRGMAKKDNFVLGNKPLIAGIFDEDSITLDNAGKWVTISGQDYTAHLASLQWPPLPGGSARKIPTGKRIDETIRDILDDADPTGRLVVDVRGIAPGDLPIVGANEVQGSKRGIPVEQSTTYWDVIYKMAVRHGLIAYVEGLDVVLTRPKSITDRDQSNIRRLAWGRNLASLKLSRKLGKEQSPTIVVQSYDPEQRKTIRVEYPPNTITPPAHAFKAHDGKVDTTHTTVKIKAKPTKPRAGKVTTTLRQRDEYQVIPVYGITDSKVLAAMAENMFHLLSRAERECVATTKDLVDLGDPAAGRAPTSLIDLASGDAFTIDWDEFNRELLADPNVSTDAKVANMVARGFNRAVAEEIAAHYTILDGLVRPLRLKEATIDFDVDEGVSIEMNLKDFIVIDGVRPDAATGAKPQGRALRNLKAALTNTGRQVGWSKARQTAQAARAKAPPVDYLALLGNR